MTQNAPMPVVTCIFDQRAYRPLPILLRSRGRFGKAIHCRVMMPGNDDEQGGRRAAFAGDGALRSRKGGKTSLPASTCQEFSS